jgi:hypothetical protein
MYEYKHIYTFRKHICTAKGRAALRAGSAGSRERIWGLVLNAESAPKHTSESVSRVCKHRVRIACVGALSDFKTEPEILTRLPANPTLRAARYVGMTPYLEGAVVRETRETWLSTERRGSAPWQH